MVIPRVVIAGTGSGVGKTTIATGIMAALARRGLRVAAFKVGPDFIDPSYHSVATGRPARNLDAFLCGAQLVPKLFANGSRAADIAVIEGVMGLFDGKAASGDFASTAHVAKLCRAPVVLVCDCARMARSVAAVVAGFCAFDPDLRIGGVILNRIASDWHEQIAREAVSELGVPIVGVVRSNRDLSAPERHLGLVPAAERRDQTRATVEQFARAAEASIDLEALQKTAHAAERFVAVPWRPQLERAGSEAKVAVAAGPAFSFVYEENLELLRACGAEVIRFDPLHEAAPEQARAIYLGGGFPEAYAAQLSHNAALRAQIRQFAQAGGAVIAECGGLLYLCRELDGAEMCGVIDADAQMTDRLKLGYRDAVAASESVLFAGGESVRAHEFHYSQTQPAAGLAPAWVLANKTAEGFVHKGVVASFLHTHWAATPKLAHRLVAACGHSPPLAVTAGGGR